MLLLRAKAHKQICLENFGEERVEIIALLPPPHKPLKIASYGGSCCRIEMSESTS